MKNEAKNSGRGTVDAVLGLMKSGQTDAPALERVRDRNSDCDYTIRFKAPKFTAICPFSGAPIFAELVIDYVPDGWLIESRSLKRYLDYLKHYDAFHEHWTITVGRRIEGFLAPRWLRIAGSWRPQAGIPVEVFFQTGAPPEGVWIPDPPAASPA